MSPVTQAKGLLPPPLKELGRPPRRTRRHKAPDLPKCLWPQGACQHAWPIYRLSRGSWPACLRARVMWSWSQGHSQSIASRAGLVCHSVLLHFLLSCMLQPCDEVTGPCSCLQEGCRIGWMGNIYHGCCSTGQGMLACCWPPCTIREWNKVIEPRGALHLCLLVNPSLCTFIPWIPPHRAKSVDQPPLYPSWGPGHQPSLTGIHPDNLSRWTEKVWVAGNLERKDSLFSYANKP